MKHELLEYKISVDNAARLMDGKTIYNGSTSHAQIIFQKLFQVSRESIDILSGSLNDELYSEPSVMKWAEYALERKVSIRVLVEDNTSIESGRNEFFNEFHDYPNFYLHIVPKEIHDFYDYHFAVSDKKSYRFEPSKLTHSAIAAFGGLETAEHLSGIFEELWSYSSRKNEPIAKEAQSAIAN